MSRAGAALVAPQPALLLAGAMDGPWLVSPCPAALRGPPSLRKTWTGRSTGEKKNEIILEHKLKMSHPYHVLQNSQFSL